MTRSALALSLLVFAPTGAVAAAVTTSLPEVVGGERNWDYRYSWVRDSAFTVDALLALGCSPEATAYFSWLLHASQLTHPDVHVLYRLDGRTAASETVLPLSGYRGSRPVRVGNAAAGQRQLDVYGELLWAARRYASSGGVLDREAARRLAGIADEVCRRWREPDAGIWEVRGRPEHFTHSKLMCWIALECARDMAARGWIPARGVARWGDAQRDIAHFVERHCWSETRQSYTRHVGATSLDAGVLLGVALGYAGGDTARLDRTIDAVTQELSRGELLDRYRDDDALSGREGAFIACSFWLVQALVRRGRLDEAAQLMDRLLSHANELGLYAEEIDPRTGEFLGNFPQGLVHLALISAAVSFEREGRR